MIIKKRDFLEVFLQLCLIGFIGQQSSLITRVISSNMRWVLLLILFLYILFYGKLLQALGANLLITLLFYLSWCLLTTGWSEVPWLSFAKSSAMILTSITLISSGSLWVKKFSWQNSLNWLIFLLVVTMLMGILGRAHESSFHKMSEFNSYQGLTSNTNYFGSLLAMIFPVLLWQIYKNFHQKKRWFVCIWASLLVLTMAFLIQSYARSAMLMAVCIAFFFILSIDLKKKIIVSSALILLGSVLLLKFSLSIEKVIYKNHADSILASRINVWDKSYVQAMLGGWFGGGFGVTIGESDFVFENLGAMGYGREKSNSQLGIIEETGFVGFGLYLILLIVFFKKAFRFYFKLEGYERVMMGLVLGAMIGVLASSFFEAWWDAPASPESIFFWMLFGVSVGLMQTLNKNGKIMNGYINLETMS